jgi:hypothetical protein
MRTGRRRSEQEKKGSISLRNEINFLMLNALANWIFKVFEDVCKDETSERVKGSAEERKKTPKYLVSPSCIGIRE